MSRTSLGLTGAALVVALGGLPGCSGENDQARHPQSGRDAAITKKQAIDRDSPLCHIASEGVQVRVKTVLDAPAQAILKMTFTPDPLGTKVKGNNVRLPNVLKGNMLEVYFRTNSSILDELDIVDLDALVADITKMPGTVNLLLEGYADARGSRVLNAEENAQKNYMYSLQRAEAIKKYLVSKLGAKVRIDIVAHGDAKATGNPDAKGLAEQLEHRKDRKVTISQNINSISVGLGKLPADVYLFDATGSMTRLLSSGESRWQAVLKHEVPKGAQVYTFTTGNTEHPCPANLAEQGVVGETPLFDSLYELMFKTPAGKTITVLTDGEDNRSRRGVAEVIKYAQEKGIKINILGIGTPASFNEILRNISVTTGGSYYLHQ